MKSTFALYATGYMILKQVIRKAVSHRELHSKIFQKIGYAPFAE